MRARHRGIESGGSRGTKPVTFIECGGPSGRTPSTAISTIRQHAMQAHAARVFRPGAHKTELRTVKETAESNDPPGQDDIRLLWSPDLLVRDPYSVLPVVGLSDLNEAAQ